MTFTVWVRDNTGGTMHISAHDAEDALAASKLALNETADDWEYDEQRAANMLWVVGIAEGDVKILEWNDE